MSAMDRAIDRVERMYEASGGVAQGGAVISADSWLTAIAIQTGLPRDEIESVLGSGLSDVFEQVVSQRVTLAEGLRGLATTAFLVGFFAAKEQRS